MRAEVVRASRRGDPSFGSGAGTATSRFPTNVANWYQQLQDYGLLSSKDRSGTYLNTVGVGAPISEHQASAYRALQHAVYQFELLGMSVNDLANLLNACTAGPRANFRLGWTGPAELCEITMPDVERHLGFRPPVACVTPHDAYPTMRSGLIRVLLCTHADWAAAYRQTCCFRPWNYRDTLARLATPAAA